MLFNSDVKRVLQGCFCLLRILCADCIVLKYSVKHCLLFFM